MGASIDPLVKKAYGVIAEKLSIALTDEEKKCVEAASAQLSFLRLTAAQQPEDVHMDMRALQKKLTPDSIHDYHFDYCTKHNPDHYYETMLRNGMPEDQAANEAAMVALSLYRIGLSLKRFNGASNNPVEFVDITIDRVINHNVHKKRDSMPEHMRDYLSEWGSEVKREYMGVRDPDAVRKAISDVTFDLFMPHRQPHRRAEPCNFTSQTQTLCNFRDFGEEGDNPPKVNHIVVGDVTAAMTMLGNAFCERHDVTRFFNTYLRGEGYAKQSTEKRNVIRKVLGEVCYRLEVPPPGELMESGWKARVQAQAETMKTRTVN